MSKLVHIYKACFPSRFGGAFHAISVAAIALICRGSSGQTACPLFPCPLISTGSGTLTTTAGDLNGDNIGDVVVGRAPSSVDVYINNGLGAFAPASSYPVQSQPHLLKIADVDNDTDNDIISLNTESGTLSVLLNNGNGTFAAAVNSPCGDSPVALALEDLDGDNDPDMVVANSITAGSLAIMRNVSGGLFVKIASLPVGKLPSSVAIARLNPDAFPDLVVSYQPATGTGGLVGAFFNNGNATFGPQIVLLQTTTVLLAVDASDLDLDGDQDIMATTYLGPVAYRLWNDGFGGFKAGGDPFVSVSGSITLFDDLNDDGRMDFCNVEASGGSAPQRIFQSLTQPNGSTGLPSNLWTCQTPISLAASDIDGDGMKDMVVGQNGAFTYARNLGGGSFLGETVLSEITASSRLIPIDFDHDGDMDLVMKSGSFSLLFQVLRNDGALHFAPPITYTTGTNGASIGVIDLVLTDVIGDSAPDAILYGTDAQIYVMKNNGSFVFSSAGAYFAGQNGSQMATADFDLDHDTDIVVPNPGSQFNLTTVNLLKNNGAGVFSVFASLPAGTNPVVVGAADMDGDGDQDIVVAGRSGITASVAILKNVGNSTFDPPSSVSLGARPARVVLGDLDGDGDVDVVISHTQTLDGGGTSSVSVLKNLGNAALGPPTMYPTVFGSFNVVINDVDGDQRPDIVAGGVTVLLNQGQGAFAASPYSVVGSPIGLAVEDFSGDGLRDIVISHQTGTNPLAILVNQGGFATITQQPADVRVANGAAAVLHVEVAFGSDLNFQWSRNDAPLSDDGHISGSQTPTLTINPAGRSDAGIYRARISNGTCSMYSVGAHLSVLAPCVADIAPVGNHNGIVNIDDLLAVIVAWGRCPSPPTACPADIAPPGGNQVVNIDDLLVVINAWGPCP